jgi:RHS repeat-associated protein
VRRTGWQDVPDTVATAPSSWRGGLPFRAALAPVLHGTALRTQLSALHVAAGVGSGNFTFTVPAAGYPGRGENSLVLALVYNSRVWQRVPYLPDQDAMDFDVDHDWPAPGWTLGFGRLVVSSTTMLLVSPVGTRYPSRQTDRHDYSSGITVLEHRTTDGSLITLSHEFGLNVNKASAWYPDGRLVEFGAPSEDGHSLFPTALRDRHGNTTSVAYVGGAGPRLDTVTDACGRVVRFGYDASGRLLTISGPGCHGNDVLLTRLHYRPLVLQHSFDPALKCDPPGSTVVIDAILNPATGTGYWFGEPNDYSEYGMLRRIRACRAMTWTPDTADPQGWVSAGQMTDLREYNYPGAPGLVHHEVPTYTHMTHSWAGQTGKPEITYFSSEPSGAGTLTAITAPDGCRTLQLDQPAANTAGLLSTLSTYSAAGELLRSIETAWESGEDGAPRVTEVKTTNPLGTGRVVYHYGPQHNQVREVLRYDNVNLLCHQSVTDYSDRPEWSARHLFNLPSQVRTFDGKGDPTSYTVYERDAAGLHRTDGIAGLDEQYLPTSTSYDRATRYRGVVTNTRRYTDPVGPTAAGGGAPVTTHTEYDLAGNVVLEDLGPQRTTWLFDQTTNYAQPTRSVVGSADPASPVKLTTSFSYNSAGLVTQSTDVNGCLTQVEYEGDGFRPVRVLLPGGAESETTYNDATLDQIIIVRDSAGTAQAVQTRTLDGLGRLAKLEKANAVGGTDVIEYQADGVGRTSRTSAPYRPGEPVVWGTMTADPLGRMLTMVAPDGSTRRWFHDEKVGDGYHVATAVRAQDAWGRERRVEFDTLGRPTAVVEPDPTSDGTLTAGTPLSTTYDYPGTEVLIRSNPHLGPPPLYRPWVDQVRRLHRDGLGRLVASHLPEKSATLDDSGAAGTSWSDVYSYDERGNLTGYTDARGIRAVIGYGADPLGRVQQISYDMAGFTDPAHPVVACPDVTFTYVSTGDLRRVALETVAHVYTQSYEYDAFPGLTETTSTFSDLPGGSLTVGYGHDELGRITTTTYPARYGKQGDPRPVVVYSYGNGGTPSGVSVDGEALASDLAYDPAGNISELSVGPLGPGQTRESYNWDRWRGSLQRQTLTRAETVLLDLSYGYAAPAGAAQPGPGSVATSITDHVVEENSLRYAYDALGRLTEAAAGPPGADPAWTESYTYDRYGNRLDVTATGSGGSRGYPIPLDGEPALAVDTGTNHVSAPGWAYDAAGNLVERPDPNTGAPVRFSYDAAGRLVAVTASSGAVLLENLYGVCHRRRAARNPATGEMTLYAWDGDHVIGQYTSPGPQAPPLTLPQWDSFGYFLGGRALAVQESSGDAWTLLHPDRIGTRYVTSSSGDSTFDADMLWLPYGLTIERATSAPAFGCGFAGYTWDPVTWLAYASHRFYDPLGGRFTSPDPLGPTAYTTADPQTLNAYAYVEGDPVNRTDPNGLVGNEVCKDLGNGVLACTAPDGTVTLYGPVEKVEAPSQSSSDPLPTTFVPVGGGAPSAGGGGRGTDATDSKRPACQPGIAGLVGVAQLADRAEAAEQAQQLFEAGHGGPYGASLAEFSMLAFSAPFALLAGVAADLLTAPAKLALPNQFRLTDRYTGLELPRAGNITATVAQGYADAARVVLRPWLDLLPTGSGPAPDCQQSNPGYAAP